MAQLLASISCIARMRNVLLLDHGIHSCCDITKRSSLEYEIAESTVEISLALNGPRDTQHEDHRMAWQR